MLEKWLTPIALKPRSSSNANRISTLSGQGCVPEAERALCRHQGFIWSFWDQRTLYSEGEVSGCILLSPHPHLLKLALVLCSYFNDSIKSGSLVGSIGKSLLQIGRIEIRKTPYPEVRSHGLSLHVGGFFRMPYYFQSVHLEHKQREVVWGDRPFISWLSENLKGCLVKYLRGLDV